MSVSMVIANFVMGGIIACVFGMFPAMTADMVEDNKSKLAPIIGNILRVVSIIMLLIGASMMIIGATMFLTNAF